MNAPRDHHFIRVFYFKQWTGFEVIWARRALDLARWKLLTP